MSDETTIINRELTASDIEAMSNGLTAGKVDLGTIRPVMVTTEYKAVFFGYMVGLPARTVHLMRARNCLYWSEDMKGFMGLAEKGPSDRCRIGPPSGITLFDVTSVVEVTPAAVKRWEAAPWSD